MKPKFIYVLCHPKFEGCVKIGRTIDVRNRLLGFNTCCPDRAFKYCYIEPLPDSTIRVIENHFSNKIIGNSYEWFFISPKEAIAIIKDIVANFEKYAIADQPAIHKVIRNRTNTKLGKKYAKAPIAKYKVQRQAAFG